jgi:hypothetical protein
MHRLHLRALFGVSLDSQICERIICGLLATPDIAAATTAVQALEMLIQQNLYIGGNVNEFHDRNLQANGSRAVTQPTQVATCCGPIIFEHEGNCAVRVGVSKK